MSTTKRCTLENGVCRVLDGVSRITVDCFEGCKDEMVKLCLPKSVKVITGKAFEDCNRLAEFEVAEGSTKFQVENGCLMGKDGTLVRAPMGRPVEIPAGTTKIGDYAFFRTKLTAVRLPASVTEIGTCAFAYSALAQVDPLPEGLTVIKDFAFRWCSLKEVTVPESVRQIGEGVFGENYGLRLDLRCRACSCGWLVGYPDKKRKWIRILLPRHISVSGELTKDVRPAVIAGFAELYVQGELEGDRSNDLRYIRNKRKELYPLALEDGNVLRLMEAEQIIPARDIDELIRTAAERGQQDVAAELEIYKNEVLGGSAQVEQERRKAERLAKRPALGKMPEEERMRVLQAFVRRRRTGEAIPEEEAQACLSYLRRNRRKLACAGPEYPELFHFLLQEEMLTKEEFPEVLEAVQQAGDTELVAAALDYQNRRFAAGAPDAALGGMDLLSGSVLTVKEAKLSWQYEKTEGGELRILGYKGRKTAVEVPQMIGKDWVTRIGDYAFSPNAKRLTEDQRTIRAQISSILIPEGVVEVGAHAFDQCRKLREVVLPATLEKLGPGAENVWSGRGEIKNPFHLCPSLENLVVADGNRSYRMEGPLFLARTEGGEELLTRIGPVTGHVVIPEGSTDLPEACFSGCSGITGLTLPGTLRKIGEKAFSDCTALTEVVIPGSVERILSDAFENCTALERVTLEEGVRSLYFGVFRGCASLTSIALPASILEFKQSALSEYLQAWSISPDHPTLSIEGPLLLDKDRRVVYDCLYSASGALTVPETVQEISYRAFESCGRLSQVTLPDSVKKLGDGLFTDCSQLTRVVLPKKVNAIGEHFFSRCVSLREVILPERAISIGKRVFFACQSLEHLTLPEGPKKIPEDAFRACKSLRELTLPESVRTIDWGAFQSCEALTDLTIPAGVTRIEDGAFDDCPNLTIHAPAGSYAETYAKENNIRFEAE
ncbi:leucine-rich repeat domain-containing protein [Flavonifractor sp. An92]|uniref:leucine-rich repeat domain-containing protein n=1 Tax=Flavonifractor sp. An92 TaxID=1965666 RepID=UPI00130266EB|nr:leucine-rich repeat domain-containing protein [Flavonifractor sp. An92]